MEKKGCCTFAHSLLVVVIQQKKKTRGGMIKPSSSWRHYQTKYIHLLYTLYYGVDCWQRLHHHHHRLLGRGGGRWRLVDMVVGGWICLHPVHGTYELFVQHNHNIQWLVRAVTHISNRRRPVMQDGLQKGRYHMYRIDGTLWRYYLLLLLASFFFLQKYPAHHLCSPGGRKQSCWQDSL